MRLGRLWIWWDWSKQDTYWLQCGAGCICVALGPINFEWLMGDCWKDAKHTAALIKDNPDLNNCPNCGGPADNGFDREFPPTPYYCTKCEADDE